MSLIGKYEGHERSESEEYHANHRTMSHSPVIFCASCSSIRSFLTFHCLGSEGPVRGRVVPIVPRVSDISFGKGTLAHGSDWCRANNFQHGLSDGNSNSIALITMCAEVSEPHWGSPLTVYLPLSDYI